MTQPIDSVRVVLFGITDPNQFLLLCESDDPGNWKLPGGKLDDGEAPNDAARRELAEELGLDKEAVKLVRAAELVNDDGVSRRYIYVGQIDPSLVKPTDEISDIDWVATDTVPTGQNRAHILSALASAQSVFHR